MKKIFGKVILAVLVFIGGMLLHGDNANAVVKAIKTTTSTGQSSFKINFSNSAELGQVVGALNAVKEKLRSRLMSMTSMTLYDFFVKNLAEIFQQNLSRELSVDPSGHLLEEICMCCARFVLSECVKFPLPNDKDIIQIDYVVLNTKLQKLIHDVSAAVSENRDCIEIGTFGESDRFVVTFKTFGKNTWGTI